MKDLNDRLDSLNNHKMQISKKDHWMLTFEEYNSPIIWSRWRLSDSEDSDVGIMVKDIKYTEFQTMPIPRPLKKR